MSPGVLGRPILFLSHWIEGLSDPKCKQLEEVGGYERMDFKKGPMHKGPGW